MSGCFDAPAMGWNGLSLVSPVLTSATPLILAAAGELVVERAGIVNIGIEGMMLSGALAAWFVDLWKGPMAGVAAAMLLAMLLAVPFAIAALIFAADQIVTGTGINLLALGVTGMAYKLTPADWQARTPLAIDPRRLMVVTLLIVVAAGWMLRFTRLGLSLTAIGESPQAARAAGIAVQRHRFLAIMFGAACAGLAGSYLSIMFNQSFTENMTDGIGFLALAMVIFGRWRATGILLAGLFFGLVHAVANHVETRSGLPPAVLRLFAALPYLISLAALAGVAGKSGAPAALGKAFSSR